MIISVNHQKVWLCTWSTPKLVQSTIFAGRLLIAYAIWLALDFCARDDLGFEYYQTLILHYSTGVTI